MNVVRVRGFLPLVSPAAGRTHCIGGRPYQCAIPSVK